MSETIYFSRDLIIQKPEEQWICAHMNIQYGEAFGDLLDEVLLANFPQLHQSIKSEEGEYLKFYTFEDLNNDPSQIFEPVNKTL